MKRILPAILFAFLLLLLETNIYAQCLGPITLSTQAQVDAFSCASVSGDLIIDDKGTGSITDLSPIFKNGLVNGDVSGRLIIGNCTKLTSLFGLHGITKTGSHVIINNNPELTSAGNAPFNLVSIAGDLRFIDLPSLNDVQSLANLKSVDGNVIIKGIGGSGNFKGLDGIPSAKYVEVSKNTFSIFVGLNNMQSCNFLNIVDNSSLSEIEAFNALKSVTKNFGYDGPLQIANNNALSALPSFSSLTFAEQVNIVNNPKLSACCSALPLITSSPPPSFLVIANNSPGCNSAGQVNAIPVLSACPTNQTVNANGNCINAFSMSDPTATDNCGYNSYVYEVTLADGMTFSGQAESGLSASYEFPLGINTVTWTVVDESNNSSSCDVSITVVDNIAPTFTNIPMSVTISCSDPFPQTPTPSVSDNCDTNPALSATSSVTMGDCTLGDIAEIQSYTWTATDAAGKTSEANWSVTVVSDFSFDLGEDISLCDESSYVINPGSIGNSYIWSTGSTAQVLSVTTSGKYALTVTSGNGCCYKDEIMVNFGNIPDASASGAVLGCSAASVMISGSSSVSGVSYSWTGPGGFSSSEQNPQVSAIGEYILTVRTNEGCEATASAVVSGDTDVPDVTASGASITCNDESVQITSSSTVASVSYSWAGPNNFSSSDQNTFVSQPGIYTVTVTAPNGCTSSTDVEVIDNATLPEINLTATVLNCNNPSTIIQSSSSTAILQYAWQGPDGFQSNDPQPTVSAGGTYMLTFTGENGCTNNAEIVVSSDFSIPSIEAEGSTISCEANSSEITASSATPNVGFMWTGPNDFVSNLQNPTITQPGEYIVTAIAENGCTNSIAVEVLADSDLPNVIGTGGTIDCLNESTTILGTTTSEGATTSWSGPGGFASTDNNPTVSIAGTYTFTVVSVNGCESFVNVEVVIDRKEPDISLGQGEVDCEEGRRQFFLNTDQSNGTFSWEGPNGYTSTIQEPFYSDAGLYAVTITGTNNCTTIGNITVDHDVNYQHEITIEGNSAEMVFTGGTPPFTVVWDNNTTGLVANNLSVGQHSVEVIDGLGCEQTYTFDIATSSIEETSNKELFSLSPNPTSDYLKLEWSEGVHKDAELSIVDIRGRLVRHLDTFFDHQKEVKVDVNWLRSGMYFLRVRSSDKNQLIKFVKI